MIPMIRVPIPFCPGKWIYIRCWSNIGPLYADRTIGMGSMGVMATPTEAKVRHYGIIPFRAPCTSIEEGKELIDRHLLTTCGGEIVTNEEWENPPADRPRFTGQDESKETFQAWKGECAKLWSEK